MVYRPGREDARAVNRGAVLAVFQLRRTLSGYAINGGACLALGAIAHGSKNPLKDFDLMGGHLAVFAWTIFKGRVFGSDFWNSFSAWQMSFSA